MTEEFIIEIMTEAFYTTFMILLPILGVSLVIGMIVSIFQAATSIQEMTLTFVPKILVTGLAIILLLPWIMQKMISITTKLFTLFNTAIR
ncbi:MAG: flagellar biosynthetic protein FliQ [Chlorobiaceae bacterium]|nr:flagellar biosynthetic protein FliQ [Chlorobiaceae bacterium]MBA4309118.1 flagellar biosynthetic protein FliQ [Chlorobiaceae bacterium]